MFDSIKGASGRSSSHVAASNPTQDTVHISIQEPGAFNEATQQNSNMSTRLTVSPRSSIQRQKITQHQQNISSTTRRDDQTAMQRKWLNPRVHSLTQPASHGPNSGAVSNQYPSTQNLMSTIHNIQKPHSAVSDSYQQHPITQGSSSLVFFQRQQESAGSNLNLATQRPPKRPLHQLESQRVAPDQPMILNSGLQAQAHPKTGHVGGEVQYVHASLQAHLLSESSFHGTETNMSSWRQQNNHSSSMMGNGTGNGHQNSSSSNKNYFKNQKQKQMTPVAEYSPIVPYKRRSIDQQQEAALQVYDDQSQQQNVTPGSPSSDLNTNIQSMQELEVLQQPALNAHHSRVSGHGHQKELPMERNQLQVDQNQHHSRENNQFKNKHQVTEGFSSTGTLTISQVNNQRENNNFVVAQRAAPIRFRELTKFDSDRNGIIPTGDSRNRQAEDGSTYGRAMVSPTSLSYTSQSIGGLPIGRAGGMVSNIMSAEALMTPDQSRSGGRPLPAQMAQQQTQNRFLEKKHDEDLKMVDTYREEDQSSFQERLQKMQVDIQRTSRLLQQHKLRQGEVVKKLEKERQQAKSETSSRPQVTRPLLQQSQQQATQPQRQPQISRQCYNSPQSRSQLSSKPATQAPEVTGVDWKQKIVANNQLLEEMANNLNSDRQSNHHPCSQSQLLHNGQALLSQESIQRAPRLNMVELSDQSGAPQQQSKNGSFMRQCGLVTSSFDNQYGGGGAEKSADTFDERRPSSKRDQKITYSKTSLDELQFMEHFRHMRAQEEANPPMPPSAVKQTPIPQQPRRSNMAQDSHERQQMDLMSTLHKRTSVDNRQQSDHQNNLLFTLPSKRLQQTNALSLGQTQQHSAALASLSGNRMMQSNGQSSRESLSQQQQQQQHQQCSVGSTQRGQKNFQTTSSLQKRLEQLNQLLRTQNNHTNCEGDAAAIIDDRAYDDQQHINQTLNSSTEKAMEYLDRRGELNNIEEPNFLDNTINLEQLQHKSRHQSREHYQPHNLYNEEGGEVGNEYSVDQLQCQEQEQEKQPGMDAQLYEILTKIGISEAHIYKFMEQEIGLYDFLLLSKDDLIELELPIAVRNRIIAFQQYYQNEGLCSDNGGALSTDFNMTDIIKQVTRSESVTAGGRSTCFNNTQMTMHGGFSKIVGPCDLSAVQEQQRGDRDCSVQQQQRVRDRPRTALERTYQGRSSKLKDLQNYVAGGSKRGANVAALITDDDYGITSMTTKPTTVNNAFHHSRPPRVKSSQMTTSQYRVMNNNTQQHHPHFQSAMTQMMAVGGSNQVGESDMAPTPTDSYTVSVNENNGNGRQLISDDLTDTTRPHALTTTQTAMNENEFNGEPSSRSYTEDGHHRYGGYGQATYGGRLHRSTINTLSTSQIAPSRNSIVTQQQQAKSESGLESDIQQRKPKKRQSRAISRSKRKSSHKRQARHLYKELKRLILSDDHQTTTTEYQSLQNEKQSATRSMQSLLLDNIASKINDSTLSSGARETLVKHELKKLVKLAIKKNSSVGESRYVDTSENYESLDQAVTKWAQQEINLSNRRHQDQTHQILSHAEDVIDVDPFDNGDIEVDQLKYSHEQFESTHDFAKDLDREGKSTILTGLIDKTSYHETTMESERDSGAVDAHGSTNQVKIYESRQNFQRKPPNLMSSSYTAGGDQMRGVGHKSSGGNAASPHGQTYSFGFVASNAQIMNSDERANFSRTNGVLPPRHPDNFFLSQTQSLSQQTKNSGSHDYMDALKQMQRSGQIGSLGLGGIDLEKIQSHLQRLTLSPSAQETRCVNRAAAAAAGDSPSDCKETEPSSQRGSSSQQHQALGPQQHHQHTSAQQLQREALNDTQMRDSDSFLQQQYTFAGRPNQPQSYLSSANGSGGGAADNRRFGNSHLLLNNGNRSQQLQQSIMKRCDSTETEKPFQLQHSDVSQRNKQLLVQAKKDIESLNSKAAAFKSKLELAKKVVKTTIKSGGRSCSEETLC